MRSAPAAYTFFKIILGILVAFGLIMLASAGVVVGQKTCGSSTCLLVHQILYGLLPGIALFYICSRIKYTTWRKLAFPALLGAIGLLILVFVPGVGFGLKGADRWIDIGPISIQPAEFLKLALILYLAAWFGGRGKQSGSVSTIYALVPFFLVLGFVALLLIKQPDFGTLGIVVLVSVAVYFFSGAKWTHFLILVLSFALIAGSLSVVSPYRFDRIKAFLNPQEDKQGSAYHINQALIAIGSGGVFGLGYGQSKQKASYLPEPVGDSIFAVIVEELGLVGGIFLVALFVLLAMSMFVIAGGISDQFGKLFVLGAASWIVIQAFINIGAITGLMPLTGVPLPLVSYGSSSFVALLVAMGIVSNIAKHA
ncbi:MAG: cell division protein FtsW [Candidatus Yanofskybacteria bacterium RIFCSPLOWO2_01_FULL_49_25]|uniref:Probable peptidoglycan glycosyltransferase FtsW n=1 Tax=Candidatus Yanofskybacteria bacterium RIFCSPLOWO2_01_FULL_49_25 TaxID=1802701 RepID=A0A1F8GSS4_9BACT|nr:MAG: cell division protein FtsW [Candidatus Yanofskybacteria bacterium RIFCSPLOWO2_01_FULL_49_25]